jgi:hypothetical protein
MLDKIIMVLKHPNSVSFSTHFARKPFKINMQTHTIHNKKTQQIKTNPIKYLKMNFLHQRIASSIPSHSVNNT